MKRRTLFTGWALFWAVLAGAQVMLSFLLFDKGLTLNGLTSATSAVIALGIGVLLCGREVDR